MKYFIFDKLKNREISTYYDSYNDASDVLYVLFDRLQKHEYKMSVNGKIINRFSIKSKIIK